MLGGISEHLKFKLAPIQLRRNDPGPFGFPLDEINPGEMFSIEIDTQPGQMTCSVYKCEPSEYTKLLSNELVISGIEKMCLITRADVEITAKKLRDTKIDTILK